MTTWILAPRVAAMLGVKTGTLAKWRRLGRGPKGAVHVSATAVAYPAEAVEAFRQECAERPVPTVRPPSRSRSD